MAGTLTKVRFTRAWQTYSVGEEIMPNGTLRDWLVANGFAEVIPGGAAGKVGTAGTTGTTGKIGKAAANLGRAVTRQIG
jgi:hypothetical protein